MKWVGLGRFWMEHQLFLVIVFALVVLTWDLLFVQLVVEVAKFSSTMMTTTITMNVSLDVMTAMRMVLSNVPFAARN
jgi:uncharacterized membrane protein